MRKIKKKRFMKIVIFMNLKALMMNIQIIKKNIIQRSIKNQKI